MSAKVHRHGLACGLCLGTLLLVFGAAAGAQEAAKHAVTFDDFRRTGNRWRIQ
jgi:hypothetical protein